MINEIAANHLYERTCIVGYSGRVSRQMQLFQEVMSSASKTTLTGIALRNNNAVVRLYAFQGIKRKAKIISEAVSKIFNSDSSEVITLTRCFGNKKLVRSLFFDPIIEM